MDDLGWSDVSYNVASYGNGVINDGDFTTPGIDALASNGIKFSNYYVNPSCTPTRTSLLTGKYSFNVGAEVPYVPFIHQVLDINSPTIAELLYDAGYDTIHIGKWHVGYAASENTPNGRGFSKSFSFYQGTHDYYDNSICIDINALGLNSTISSLLQTQIGSSCITSYDLFEDNEIANPNKYRHIYSTKLFVQKILDYIDDYYNKCIVDESSSDSEETEINDDDDDDNNTNNGLSSSEEDDENCKPMFMWYSDHTPHFPLQNPPDENLYGDSIDYSNCDNVVNHFRKILCKMMKYFDNALSDIIVPKLQEKNIYDNTLIIFSSDNGGRTGNDTTGANAYGQSLPYRGTKLTSFEGGILAPAFMSGGWLSSNYPNLVGTTHTPITFIGDILPTLLTIINRSDLIPDDIDGINQWENIKYQTNEGRDEIAFINYQNNYYITSYIRVGDYKLVVNGSTSAITRNYVKYDHTVVGNLYHTSISAFKPYMLFNIAVDPYETNDLSTNPLYLNTISTLLSRLNELRDNRMPHLVKRSNGGIAAAVDNYNDKEKYWISIPWKDDATYVAIDNDPTANVNDIVAELLE